MAKNRESRNVKIKVRFTTKTRDFAMLPKTCPDAKIGLNKKKNNFIFFWS